MDSRSQRSKDAKSGLVPLNRDIHADSGRGVSNRGATHPTRIVPLLGVGIVVVFLIGWASIGGPLNPESVENSLKRSYAGTYPALGGGIPLLLDIREEAHKPICDSFTLVSLMSTQSDVNSSVTTTNRALSQRFPRALESLAGHALLDEIVLILEETNHMVSAVLRLQELYSSIRPLYLQRDLEAESALKAAKLSDYQNVLMNANPLIVAWLGYDFMDMYYNPWLEKRAKMKESKLGVAALEEDSERLEEIERMALEIRRDLERLVIALIKGNIMVSRGDEN